MVAPPMPQDATLPPQAVPCYSRVGDGCVKSACSRAPEGALVALKRRYDPEVTHHRAKVAGYVRVGDKERAEHHRQELADALIVAAAKAVAARLPELPPEKRERVRALLGGAR